MADTSDSFSLEHSLNHFLADRLASVKPSPSMAAKARVEKLRAEGRTIIDFTIGEPDFATPEHIVQAGIAALNNGHTRYTASPGTPALRKAIAAKLLRENQLRFRTEEIIVGCGAKHIIFNAFAASLNPGDEVIVPAPYWVSYPDMVTVNGGVPVMVPCAAGDGFKLSVDKLAAAITPATKWLILNTPNNPTGAVYSAAELSALCAVLRQHPHVWIMTDEIYEHFVYDVAHTSILNVGNDLACRALLVNGMSKAYAMTGWRIGYGAGPAPLIAAINLLLTQSTTCASAVSQEAAVVALESSQACVQEAAALFRSRRDRMVALLSAIPGMTCSMPDGAFYVFPGVDRLLGKTTPEGRVLTSDLEVMLYFLDAAGVATIDGGSYGMPGYLRMSFATSMAQLEDGCHHLKMAVENLR